jgi:hypothetical protein
MYSTCTLFSVILSGLYVSGTALNPSERAKDMHFLISGVNVFISPVGTSLICFSVQTISPICCVLCFCSAVTSLICCLIAVAENKHKARLRHSDARKHAHTHTHTHTHTDRHKHTHTH